MLKNEVDYVCVIVGFARFRNLESEAAVYVFQKADQNPHKRGLAHDCQKSSWPQRGTINILKVICEGMG